MTPESFLQAITALSRTEQVSDAYVRAAELLGIGRRSVIRYATGEAEVPVSVQRMITLLQRHGVPRGW